MSAQPATAPDPVADRELAERLRSEVRQPSAVARHAIMPVILLAALAVLYVHVSGLDLDRIEQRVLSWPNIRQRLLEHVWLAGLATVGIVAISVPLGIMVTRPWARRITPVALSLANAGQGIPSLGVLALLAVLLFTGVRTALIALIVYGILPVLRNTMVGIQQVDPAEIEAGRGMGMTTGQVLRQIELPLAVPVILAGIRVSLILCVGTATVAWTIGAGGLGVIIQQGISMQRVDSVLLTGAVLTAVLALSVDWLAGVVEDVLKPRGL